MKPSYLTTLLYFLPNVGKSYTKKIYWFIRWKLNQVLHMKQGLFVEFRHHFRYSRKPPYYCSVGSRTIFEEFCVVSAKQGTIEIGENCWFGLRAIIMGPARIGDNVSTGPNIAIVGPRHAVRGYEHDESACTVIGNNAWISTGSIIHFGVHIGENAIIAPGSVVTRDVPANAFYGGNPARDLSMMMKALQKKQ